MKFKEILDKFSEHQKPENVKKRLKEQIEVEKLKAELDKVRSKRKPKTFSIGDVEIK